MSQMDYCCVEVVLGFDETNGILTQSREGAKNGNAL